ncbi:MAG: methyltransferase domain-containing protein [Acidobacteria bacterium]|nr:methyltransferase domain-containing protein [Acidobacteriota bacterium]
MPPDLSVVIPAHNEAANLRVLLPQLRTILDGLGIRSEVLVVVRDDDPDTLEAARGGLAAVTRQSEPGYGGALRTGLARAEGEHVLTMDADLSHPPTFAADLWRRRDEAEILIASRYVAGGSAHMPLVRAVLSRVLNRFFAWGLGVPLRDLSSGFRLYRKSALSMDEDRARDFDILPEIVIRAYTNGWRVREIPFRYEPRVHGSSNARVIPFGLAYLRTFRRLWVTRNDVKAADYEDRAYDSRHPPQRYWQRRRHALIRELVPEGEPVLDLGCGSSRLLGELPPGSVGLDILMGKLRRSRRFGRPLVQASASRLPFSDGTFGCVVASQLIELVPPEEDVLAEMSRVVRPGGLVILSTPDYGRRRWRVLGALYSRMVPGAVWTPPLARYSRRRLVDAVQDQGLTLEAARDILGAEMILAFRKGQDSGA